MKENFKRVKLLDTIRGVCIILMIIYHSCFCIINFGFFEEVDWLYKAFEFFNTDYYTVIWLITLCCFFMIAGITSKFSRNNFKRSLIIICTALIISIVTIMRSEDLAIYFGVLHCMGFCMLIYAIIEKFFFKLSEKINFVLMFSLFFICYFLIEVYFIRIIKIIPITPVKLFDVEIPLYILGFYSTTFYSADYYPIIPWIFMFFAGVAFGQILREGNAPKFMYEAQIKPLSFIGRHPLIIYASHLPVIILILFILNMIL